MPSPAPNRSAQGCRTDSDARTDRERIAAAARAVQARMLKYKKPGESIVDRFVSERRALWGEEG